MRDKNEAEGRKFNMPERMEYAVLFARNCMIVLLGHPEIFCANEVLDNAGATDQH